MAKCLDDAPRHAESWYRSLFEQTPAGMFVIGVDGSIVECNLAFAEALGYVSTVEVLALRAPALFFEPTEQANFLGKLHQKGILTNFEWSVRGRQGNKVCLLVNARVLEPRSPEPLAVGSVVDISERKIEDEEIQKHLRLTASLADLGQLALHRSAADHLPQQAVEQLASDLEADYCQILDCSGAGGSLRFVAGAGWTGAEARPLRLDCGQRAQVEVNGHDLPVLCCTQTSGNAHWLTEQGFASAMSVTIGSDEGPCGILSVHSRRVRYFDDQEVSFLQSAANVLAAAMNQLETDQELRTSEERLRLAMEAASLGIWDRDLKTDQITWSRRPEHDAHDLVQQIRQAGERGANLTRQILSFSRHQVVAPRKLDINAVIRNMESMLRRLIGEDLEFQTDLDADAGPVKADPGQLDQVIVNLVINARDAMPTGGRLTVSTRSLEFTPADLEGRPDARVGPYVMLMVSDTGVGMDEATLARIFEPFFTTKGMHGTGLGLATVYGIVHQARGFIEVASTPGEGAAFHVYLPCAQEPAVAEVLVAEDDQIFHSDQTVLLVEDEAGVRKLVRHMLESLGLHVLEAPCGPDAIELSHGYADTIHLLVTDVVMPRMSGRELADRLQTSRPEMKVLYMSGYVDDAVVLHGVFHAEAVFLQKPFDAASLAAKVKVSLTRR